MYLPKFPYPPNISTLFAIIILIITIYQSYIHLSIYVSIYISIYVSIYLIISAVSYEYIEYKIINKNVSVCLDDDFGQCLNFVIKIGLVVG